MGCTGSLIASDLVLTAAHCVKDGVTVRFGHTASSSPYRGTGMSVVDSRIGTGWDLAKQANKDGTNRNDIAILKLARPVSIKPVPIRTVAPPVGTRVNAVGWGCTDKPNPPAGCVKFPTKLMQTSLTVTRAGDCGTAAFWKLPAAMAGANICTKGNNTNINHGDSGGPLLLFQGGGFSLVGVTSIRSDAKQYWNRAAFTSAAYESQWLADSINSLHGVTPPAGGGGGSTPPPSTAAISIAWSIAHPTWISMTTSGLAPGTYQYMCIFGSGGNRTYNVTLSGGTQTFDNGATCYDGIAGDTVRVTIGGVTSNTLRVPGPQPPPATTYGETTGGAANTWTNYTNAGGAQGQTIPAYTTVQISCAIEGFRVADGNVWWYRIASSPWSNSYYVSADAFYNNGASSGSLLGTPFVDPAVPHC